MATILVIDYDMSLALRMQLTLRNQGLDVAVASSVLRDAAAIDTGNADVAVVDTAMSPTDLLTAMRSISRSASSIPVIAASSSAIDARRSAVDGSAVPVQPRANPLLAVTTLVSAP